MDKRNWFSFTKLAVAAVPCGTIPDVFVTPSLNYTTQAKALQEDKFNCFKNNSETVYGSFAREYYESLQIYLMRCKNGTSNIICKSDDEINKKLTGGYLQLYYTNRYIDVTDFKNPVKEYLEAYYSQLDPASSRIVDFFLKKVNITSDQGSVFEELVTNEYVMYDYFREQYDSKISET